ncbi:hypothetical protein NST33_17580 [Paenibacillus sp. FSL L8-0435]|uniref:hypothetical protein n=1 Tax=Paenibacillus sp. FSL L8-0435 TaxID=2954618 RepID=UPI0030DA294C
MNISLTERRIAEYTVVSTHSSDKNSLYTEKELNDKVSYWIEGVMNKYLPFENSNTDE